MVASRSSGQRCLAGYEVSIERGTMMEKTVISRTAFISAAGVAMLSLAGCGASRQKEGSVGFNSDRPVKDKATSSTPSGGGTAATDSIANTSKDDAFDTWSKDCWDAHGNISLSALLELKGWQLQEFATQQGFKWDSASSMYLNSDRRGLSVCEINMDGSTPWLSEDEIGKLDKGGTGSRVMYTLIIGGYTSGEDVIKGFTVPVEDRAKVSTDSWIACVYGSNMARHVATIDPIESGDYRLDLITEDAIKTGVFTEGGGAPLITEYWIEKTGHELN